MSSPSGNAVQVTGGSPVVEGDGNLDSMVMGPSSLKVGQAARPSELRAAVGSTFKAMRSRLVSFASKGPAWGDLDENLGAVSARNSFEALGEVAPLSGAGENEEKRTSSGELEAHVTHGKVDVGEVANVNMPSQGINSSWSGENGEVASTPADREARYSVLPSDDGMNVVRKDSLDWNGRVSSVPRRVPHGRGSSFNDGDRTITVEEFNELKQLLLSVSLLSGEPVRPGTVDRSQVPIRGSQFSVVPSVVSSLNRVETSSVTLSNVSERSPSPSGSPLSSSSSSESSLTSSGDEEEANDWHEATSRKKQKRAMRSLADLKAKLSRHLSLERIEELLTTLSSKADKVKLCRLLLEMRVKLPLLSEVPTLTGSDLLVLLGETSDSVKGKLTKATIDKYVPIDPAKRDLLRDSPWIKFEADVCATSDLSGWLSPACFLLLRQHNTTMAQLIAPRNNEILYSWLVRSIGEKARHIASVHTGNGVKLYLALYEATEGSGRVLLHELSLLETLFKLQFVEDSKLSFTEVASRLTSLVTKLETRLSSSEFCFRFPDHLTALLLVRALPPRLSSAVHTMLQLNDASTLTIHVVMDMVNTYLASNPSRSGGTSVGSNGGLPRSGGHSGQGSTPGSKPNRVGGYQGANAVSESCSRCGKAHSIKLCPVSEHYKCRKCDKPGHIAIACKSQVTKQVRFGGAHVAISGDFTAHRKRNGRTAPQISSLSHHVVSCHLDSGASQHYTGDIRLRSFLHPHPGYETVKVASGHTFPVTMVGDVLTYLPDNRVLVLQEMKFVPSMRIGTLLSVSQLLGDHFVVDFTSLQVVTPDGSCLPIYTVNGQFFVDILIVPREIYEPPYNNSIRRGPPPRGSRGPSRRPSAPIPAVSTSFETLQERARLNHLAYGLALSSDEVLAGESESSRISYEASSGTPVDDCIPVASIPADSAPLSKGCLIRAVASWFRAAPGTKWPADGVWHGKILSSRQTKKKGTTYQCFFFFDRKTVSMPGSAIEVDPSPLPAEWMRNPRLIPAVVTETGPVLSSLAESAPVPVVDSVRELISTPVRATEGIVRSIEESSSDDLVNAGFDAVCTPDQVRTPLEIAAINSSLASDRNLQLHYSLSHLNFKDMQSLSRKEHGLALDPKGSFSCASCDMAKATIKGDQSGRKAFSVFDVLHTDSGGPVNVASSRGEKYYYLFVDHVSSYAWVYFAPDLTASSLIRVVEQLRADTGRYPKSFHCDNGSDYTSAEFRSFARRHGVKLTYSTPYHHNEAGKAERYQRTLWEAIRSTWLSSGAPPTLWPYMAKYAVFCRTKVPSYVLGGRSSYEIMFEKAPDLSMLRPFGCIVYHNTHSDVGGKFRRKAAVGVFLGINTEMSEYTYIIGVQYEGSSRMYIKHSTDVTFDTGRMYFELPTAELTIIDESDSVAVPEGDELPELVPVETESPDLIPVEPELEEFALFSEMDLSDAFTQCSVGDMEGVALLAREEDGPDASVMMSVPDGVPTHIKVPTSSKELETSFSISDAAPWIAAADKEWNENMLVNVMEPEWFKVEDIKAAGYSILPSHNVYTYKQAANNEPARFKVRTVLGGHRENPDHIGVTFAPTVSTLNVRLMPVLLMMFRARPDGRVYVMRSGDVSNAFGFADLPEGKHVYVFPPMSRYTKRGFCRKLKKAMYGMKEAPFLWNKAFSKIIIALGFIQSDIDPCVYYFLEEGDLIAVMVVFVDDILFVGEECLWIAVINELLVKLPIKDLGQPNKYLGMNVQVTENGVYLHHSDYVNRLLERFHGTGLNAVKTPCDHNARLVRSVDFDESDRIPYMQLVGSLNHCAVYTRPDISYAVSELSKHLQTPSEEHFRAAKRVLRYLKGTPNLGLLAKGGSWNFKVEVYCDADWATDPVTRLSKTGTVIIANGMVIGYYSKDQKSIALSSCASELFALSQAIRMVVFLRSLYVELTLLSEEDAVTIYCDSKSAIDIIHSNGSTVPQKHIDIRLKYVQEVVASKKVRVVYVNTADNLADGFTKALGIDLFTRNFSRLMTTCEVEE